MLRGKITRQKPEAATPMLNAAYLRAALPQADASSPRRSAMLGSSRRDLGFIARQRSRGPTLSRLMNKQSKDNIAVDLRFLAHPTGHNTNPNPLVTGPTIRLNDRHAKIRRDGYRKTLSR